MNAPRRSALDGLIAAERDHAVQPSPAAAAQGWDRLRRALPGAALMPEFDVAPSSLGSAGAGKATAASQWMGSWRAWVSSSGGWVGKTIVGGVVATTVTAGVLASRPDDARGTRAATVPEVAADRAQAAMPAAVPPTPTPTPTPEPAQLPSTIATTTAAIVEPPPIAAAATTRRSRSATARAPEPSPPAATLDDEAALLRAANRALGAGDTALALARLSEHASRFERGTLAQDRDALRVVVLCRAGRRSDAVAARKRFLERWPQSVHAARVRAACPDPEP
ncbi:MAG: hypothetical protein IPK74_37135 [Deltaproteobacteria bacterium]|nr:hypothetical protein [Deltaproteobacteria bacterium]